MFRIVIFLFLSAELFSGVYRYHPSSALHLGAGFNPLFPDRSFRKCLEFDDKISLDGEGAVTTKYAMNLIRSRKDLYETLGISASLSARGTFWNVGASSDYFKEHAFHSDTINWIIAGRTLFGRSSMKNVRLIDEAQTLIDEGEYDRFESMCGSEFVNIERKQVLIAAIFTISNVSEEEKEKLETQFNASYSGGFFSVDAKMKYAHFYQQASSVSQVNMSIYAIGGEGIMGFSGLIEAPNELEKIQTVLSEYMSKLDEEHAAPAAYMTGSMSVFGWKGMTPIDVYKRERVLAEIFHRYKDAEQTIQRLRNLLAYGSTGAFETLKEEQLEQYEKHLSVYGEYLEALLFFADTCYAEPKACNLPDSEPDQVLWPVNIIDGCEKLRLKAHRVGLIDEFELVRMRQDKTAPIFKTVSQGITAIIMCHNLDVS